MIFLFLTILCSTSIALILKYSSVNKGNSILLLASNYLSASVIGFVLFIIERGATFSIESLLFGAGLGSIFVFAFFAFSESVGKAGTALSTVSSRLSVFIPILLSIIFFNEEPGLIQLTGFVFTFITIILFYLSLRRDKTKNIKPADYFFLFALLIGIGIADFSLKIFQSLRPPSDKQFFIFSIFFFAFIYTASLVFIKSISFNKKTFSSGIILGVPNVFSSIFLLAALENMKAIVIYPTANIGIILLTAISAFLIWKEKLNRLAKFSLFTGIISIILLNL